MENNCSPQHYCVMSSVEESHQVAMTPLLMALQGTKHGIFTVPTEYIQILTIRNAFTPI